MPFVAGLVSRYRKHRRVPQRRRRYKQLKDGTTVSVTADDAVVGPTARSGVDDDRGDDEDDDDDDGDGNDDGRVGRDHGHDDHAPLRQSASSDLP